MQIFFVFFFTFLHYSTNSQCLSSKTRRRLSKPLRQKRAYSHTGGLGSEPRIAEGRGTIAVGRTIKSHGWSILKDIHDSTKKTPHSCGVFLFIWLSLNLI